MTVLCVPSPQGKSGLRYTGWALYVVELSADNLNARSRHGSASRDPESVAHATASPILSTYLL